MSFISRAPVFAIARAASRANASRFGSRTFVVAAAKTHTLPDLPYAYDALEPHICEEIMTLHHKRHHQAYVNGLNAAQESYASAQSVEEKIALQQAIKFNGGGHINHTLFWRNLAPVSESGGQLSEGPLKTAIERDFGSVEEMKKKVNAATAGIQGSGWVGWGITSQTRSSKWSQPRIKTLYSAFYIQYKNVKPDYLNAIWNVINFKEAEKRLVEATQ